MPPARVEPVSFKWLGRIAAVCAALLTVEFLPFLFCAREGNAYFHGDREKVELLLHNAGRHTENLGDPSRFQTGSARFDAEWAFGTYLMTALGSAQTAREYEGKRDEALYVLRLAMQKLADPATRKFDTDAWQGDAIAASSSQDHCAFLCYYALALSLARTVDPTPARDAMHDILIDTLRKNIERRESMLLETYPGESYPIDTSAAIAAIALHAKITNRPQDTFLVAWEKKAREHFLDPKTGLAYQAVDAKSGTVRDRERGSGSAAMSYYLSFALPELSRDLWKSIRRELYTEVLGFGGVREVPRGAPHKSDVDSGPVIFGMSVSASGFAIGAARANGDQRAYRALYASAYLMGTPVETSERKSFISGGPIGDTILFAMLTARKF